MEIWKPIQGFEGKYEISSYGNVKSLSYQKSGKIRLLKPIINKAGYASVSLTTSKNIFRINRLVAMHFIPNPENKPQVNHIDENKLNNRVENLEWATAKENTNHGTKIERIAKAQMKKVIQYDFNGNIIAIHESASSLKKHGYGQGNISSVCRGVRKHAYGFKWKYHD